MRGGSMLDYLANNAAACLEALGISGGGASDTFRIVTSFPATVASDDVVLLVTATGTIALPTPTAGRKLVFRARGGDLTLTHSSVETFSGGLDTSLSLLDGYGVTLRGDGSRWLIFPG